MYTNITKSGESPSVKSILIDKIMDNYRQSSSFSDNVIVTIDDDVALKLEKAKNDHEIVIRNMLANAIYVSPLMKMDYENSNDCLRMEEFQTTRRQAIKELDEYGMEASAYIEDFKYLIVTCDCGGVIGEVAEVEPDQIDDIASMVSRLYSDYGPVQGNCDALIEEYYKQYLA